MVHQDFWKEATQAKKTEKEGTWKPKLIKHSFAISSILLGVIVNSELARLWKRDNFCACWNFMDWECSLCYD
ncbi:hypothetical protein LOK49_LG06G01177 [Camellia lanceoleosa]|uniref:Uncharacterized protein n=1 Tax=Camellia lanceoleosa TaxID=1840588 RepID=A0ACC0HBW9_9ERIC|nr:hypothetical protein LOK49_LG06G01177 [Camellia lanceoleosa]